MNKKKKIFFKRKQPRSNMANVDLCSVNIVSEAERIIDEYIFKTGYHENSKKPILKTLVFTCTGIALAFFLIKVMFV